MKEMVQYLLLVCSVNSPGADDDLDTSTLNAPRVQDMNDVMTVR